MANTYAWGGTAGMRDIVPAPNGILISASLFTIRVAAEDATCPTSNFVKHVHYITQKLY